MRKRRVGLTEDRLRFLYCLRVTHWHARRAARRTVAPRFRHRRPGSRPRAVRTRRSAARMATRAGPDDDPHEPGSPRECLSVRR